MLRRSASMFFCLAVALGALGGAACETKSVSNAGGGTLFPSRAAAVGEFSDNPLLASVPRDTPYVFASFRPAPIDLFRKMWSAMAPLWRKAYEQYAAKAEGSEDDRRMVKELFETVEGLDVKTIEEHGFSTKARFAIYGLGAYPVVRVEVANGDRVFQLIQKTAERWKAPLPAATQRSGHRYWIAGKPELSVFVSVAAKQVVAMMAPRTVLDASVAALVGEQPPAKPMTTADLRAVAERDGFTGFGVGYLDSVAVAGLATRAAGLPAACSSAITALAGRVPRVSVGHGDITARDLAWGMVVELAPDLVTELRAMSGSLVGLDRLATLRPMFALAVAANVDGGRKVLGRIAGAVQELGERCENTTMVEAAVKIADVAKRPLPPVVAGLRGGIVVANNLKMGPRGPESMEGYASIQLDQPGELLKLANLPELNVPLDGKPHPLPSQIPYPGQFAVNDHVIGVGIGPDAATTSVSALQGKAVPAPLALMRFDYARFADFIPVQAGKTEEVEMARRMLAAFGLATVQMLFDARGFVWWTTIDLK